MKALYILTFFLLFALTETIAQPGWSWAKSGLGNEFDLAAAVATDASGNVFVTGYYASDVLDLGTITLTNGAIGFDEVFVTKYDASGALQWAYSAGGDDDDKATAIATDASGNVYVTGYYRGTIIFGNDTLTSVGNADIFIVKFDNAGNVLGSISEGGLGLEIPYALHVDAAGNLLVAGRFSSNSITFGSTTLTQQGSMDIFVAKYDINGIITWAKGFGSGSNDEAYAISTDAQLDIYVTGYFNQNISFGSTSFSTSGLADIFLLKLDQNGNVKWARKANGNGDDRGKAIFVDNDGNSYVTGYFVSPSLTFNSTTVNSGGSDNSFIVKYDSSGNFIRVFAMGSDSRANAVAVGGNEVYITGVCRADTFYFGSHILPIAGSADFYVANLDTLFNTDWVVKQSADGNSNEEAYAISSGPGGNIYIAGDFDSNPISFGSSGLAAPTSNGFDMFVAKLGAGVNAVETITFENNISIYPNPSHGSFTIRSNKVIDELKLINLLGEEVISMSSIEDGSTIKLNVTPGVYMLKMTVDGKMTVKKVVVE